MIEKKKIKDIVFNEIIERIYICNWEQFFTIYLTFKQNAKEHIKEVNAWFSLEDAKYHFDHNLICDNLYNKELVKVELNVEYIERQLTIFFEADNEDYLTLEMLNNINYFVYIFKDGACYWDDDIYPMLRERIYFKVFRKKLYRLNTKLL